MYRTVQGPYQYPYLSSNRALRCGQGERSETADASAKRLSDNESDIEVLAPPSCFEEESTERNGVDGAVSLPVFKGPKISRLCRSRAETGVMLWKEETHDVELVAFVEH